MSKEAFAKKFATDKTFAQKVCGLKTVEEIKALTQAEGIGLSDEEAGSVLSKLQKMNEDGITLDDMTLDLAAGGSGAPGPGCFYAKDEGKPGTMTSPSIVGCARKHNA